MATTVPDPVLDTRNEDEIAAQAIGGLPDELSDRSDSNPAVVILEAAAYIVGRLLFQINQWPAAVIQKALALVGVTLLVAQKATTVQTFTFSAPQSTDTPIPTGTQVSTADGSIVFETTADAELAAYTAPAGTITFTAGSAAVVGVGTTFLAVWATDGYKIGLQGANGSPPTVWYTVTGYTNATNLTIGTSATATASGAFFAGPVIATAAAQAAVAGVAGNVGAGTLVTMNGSINGVASTTNGAAASGGTEIETNEEAIARAATAFSSRDVAITETDFEMFATTSLGRPGRAKAAAGYNVDTVTPGYVTCALLSPSWTYASSVSTAERAAVARDMQRRYPVGVTFVDHAALLYPVEPSCCVIRRSDYDETTVRRNIAIAINNYFTPGVYTQTAASGSQDVAGAYPWGRTIYVTDLVDLVEGVEGVDRVHAINGRPAVGPQWSVDFPSNITFIAATGPHTCASTAGIVAGQTFIIDTANTAVYLIVSLVVDTSITLDRAWDGGVAGASPTVVPFFTAQDDAMNSKWYNLPLARVNSANGLSIDTTDATYFARSIRVVGVAT